MKFLKLIVGINFIFVVSIHSQWVKFNDGLPSEAQFYTGVAVDACGDNTVVIAMRQGTVYNNLKQKMFIFIPYDTNNHSWIDISLPDEKIAVTDISIVNKDCIWVCTSSIEYGNEIYTTTDGGKIWNKQNIDLPNVGFINHIKMFDTFNGVAVADCAYPYDDSPMPILITTDGGKNWINKNKNNFINYSIYNSWIGISIVNISTGFVRGNSIEDQNPPMYKTIDSGKTWTPLKLTYSQAGYICFYNDKIGIVLPFGVVGKLWRTNDGGNTWIYDSLTCSIYPKWGNPALVFSKTDPSRVWFGWDKDLLFSSDTGKTWTKQEHPDIGSIIDMVFIDNYHGWILGSKGVLRTQNGGMTDIKRTIQLPNSYKLYQNYPNPFNPETTIRFELPEKTKVSLIIYDLLGREVEKLIDGEKEAGSYSIIWNAKNLTSGIYYYKLVVSGANPIIINDHIEIKKMLLLK
jgi:photosystem II stability/assembly factor-like uncharacterized protein